MYLCQYTHTYTRNQRLNQNFELPLPFSTTSVVVGKYSEKGKTGENERERCITVESAFEN